MKILIYLSLLFITSCTVPKHEPSIFVQNIYEQDIVWQQFPIKFNFHQSVPEHLKVIIESEMKQFNLIYGKTVFVIDKKDITTNYIKRDHKNTIYLDDVKKNRPNEELRPSEQARTSVFWAGDEIQETDIFFNVKYFTNGYDLNTLTRHELLHALGLKHLKTAELMNSELPQHTVRPWDFNLIRIVHQKMNGSKLLVGSNE